SSSRMKSFRSTGTPARATAARRSPTDPPKNGPSVSTERAAAPLRAYRSARSAGSRSSRIEPADGERRFTSAITATVSRRSAAANEGGREALAASRSTDARRARKVGNWSRVELRIWSSETGILSFGRSSGIVVRALFGRTVDEETSDAPDQAPERNSRLPAAPHSRAGLRAELRGDRRAVRLPVARHGPRAPDEPRAEGVHPALVQRKPLHRGAATARDLGRQRHSPARQSRGRHAHRVADASGDHRGARSDAPPARPQLRPPRAGHLDDRRAHPGWRRHVSALECV